LLQIYNDLRIIFKLFFRNFFLQIITELRTIIFPIFINPMLQMYNKLYILFKRSLLNVPCLRLSTLYVQSAYTHVVYLFYFELSVIINIVTIVY